VLWFVGSVFFLLVPILCVGKVFEEVGSLLTPVSSPHDQRKKDELIVKKDGWSLDMTAPVLEHPSEAALQGWVPAGSAPSGQCAGIKGEHFWGSGGHSHFDHELRHCAAPCLGQTGCASNCMRSSFHYSEGCASCFGELVGCTAGHCMWQCMGGGNSPSCASCVRDSCMPAFKRCSGIGYDDDTGRRLMSWTTADGEEEKVLLV